jgi:hypothetical protein
MTTDIQTDLEQIKIRIRRVGQNIPTVVDVDGTMSSVGNCMQACVATVLQSDFVMIPHFGDQEYLKLYGGDFWTGLREWSRSIGLHCVELDKQDAGLMSDVPLYIGIGVCKNKVPGQMVFDHAVVCSYGKMIHDPNPETDGVKSFKNFVMFSVMDAERFCGWCKTEVQRVRSSIGLFGTMPIDLIEDPEVRARARDEWNALTRPQKVKQMQSIINDVSAAEKAVSHNVEHRLCDLLGKRWIPTDSIESLLAEVKARMN